MDSRLRIGILCHPTYGGSGVVASELALSLADKGHDITGPTHEHPAVITELTAWVDKVNQEFARVEHVRKFRVLPRSLSEKDGELTPTLKLKRRVIDKNWSELIEAMYSDPAA